MNSPLRLEIGELKIEDDITVEFTVPQVWRNCGSNNMIILLCYVMMLYIILTCIFMSILMMVADGFTVHGPSGPLFAPLGSSVVLLCYVNELLVMEDLEVEWRRTDSGTLVHLYQDGESRPEVQQQDYHERAHFFTDQIQHGNFSLRLDNLRAEDEGRYTCRVYSQQGSGETVVQIKHECSVCYLAL
ncbi:hypothetical protein cypCar_00035857 [Cyprinus carpio]|nr:hypothetical protein cypCar_00035857 [Cyprinus carpio]